MRMRTLIVSVAAMALGMSAVSALAQPAPGERGEGRWQAGRMGGNIERMAEQLNLTPEQKKQVDAIMADQRQRVAAIMEESRQKLHDVLTEEQRTKLRELMPAQGAGAGGLADPVSRLENAVSALDLSDDQKSKLKDVFAGYRAEFEAIRKETGDNRQAMMQQSRPLIQEMRAEVTALLTPEQSEKLQAQAGAWRGRDGQAGPNRPGRGAEGGRRNPDKQ